MNSVDIPDEWIREMTKENYRKKKPVGKTVDYSEKLIEMESHVTFNNYGKGRRDRENDK